MQHTAWRVAVEAPAEFKSRYEVWVPLACCEPRINDGRVRIRGRVTDCFIAKHTCVCMETGGVHIIDTRQLWAWSWV